jgi:hypothetical protein
MWKVKFVDKDGRVVILSVHTHAEAEIVALLLDQLPQSEFICRPFITNRP